MNSWLVKERQIHCIFELFSAGHNPHECIQGHRLNEYSLFCDRGHLDRLDPLVKRSLLTSGLHLYAAVHLNPSFSVRDVLWTPLTSRGRQRFTWRLRGAQWKCAGRCCRELGAGCSMRRTTAGSHHWSSANRGKRSGESAVFRKLYKEKSLTTIIPLCGHTSRLLFSLGIMMQINLLPYYVIFFLQASATHQATESVQ